MNVRANQKIAATGLLLYLLNKWGRFLFTFIISIKKK